VLEDARHALVAWQGAASEVIFSWPRQQGDARLLRSTLVPVAPAFASPAAHATRAATVRAAGRLVPWVDTGLPPLVAAAGIVGGVRVLELQSLCPFRAAAEIRLDARALDTPTPGVSPRGRGELMHAALATFWGDIGSHAELLARGAAGLQRAAAAAVAAALGRQRRFLPGPRLVALEQAWQERALLALAERELEREPFTVAELEQAHVLQIGGRELHTRLDRLDRLDEGGTVLIDYKTGRGLPHRWVGHRPDALQLPVYAAYHAETPVAVAFARLPLATTGFDGLAQRDGILPDVPSLAHTRKQQLRGRAWADVISEWRVVAARIAGEFASGAAAVDPTDEACEQCTLAALCRISERALVDPELAEATDDEADRGGGA
jgi:ATP-dependent helicase/nuclease subunit B